MWLWRQSKKLLLHLVLGDPKYFFHLFFKLSPRPVPLVPHLCPPLGPQYIRPQVGYVFFPELHLVAPERWIQGEYCPFYRTPEGIEILGFRQLFFSQWADLRFEQFYHVGRHMDTCLHEGKLLAMGLWRRRVVLVSRRCSKGGGWPPASLLGIRLLQRFFHSHFGNFRG